MITEKFLKLREKNKGNTIIGINDIVVGYSIVLVFFYLFFYNIDEFISRSHNNFFSLYFTWELLIPYHPIAFLPYFGIFILPFFIPYNSFTHRDFLSLILTLVFAIIVGGIFFLLIPCKLGFPPRNIANDLESFIVTITGKHNLFPSMHVCLTIIICHSYYPKVSRKIKLLLIFIVIILSLSTLFTHQHHIIDVIGGAFLALTSIQLIKRIV